MARLNIVRRPLREVAGSDTIVGCVATIGADPRSRGYHVAVLEGVEVPVSTPRLRTETTSPFANCVIVDQLRQVIPTHQAGTPNTSVINMTRLLEDVYTPEVVVNEYYEPRNMVPFEVMLERRTYFKCFYASRSQGPIYMSNPIAVLEDAGVVRVPIRNPELRKYANGDYWESSYHWADAGDDEAILARVVPAFILSVLKIGEFRRTVFLLIEVGTFRGGQGYVLSVKTDNILESDDWRRADPVEYERQ